MVMYWYRCVTGIYDPTLKCPLLGTDVSAHFCVICPYRGKECKDPAWFPKLLKKRSESYNSRLKKILESVSGLER
jgi:hypothetical protein